MDFYGSYGNKYEWSPRNPIVYIKGRKKRVIAKINNKIRKNEISLNDYFFELLYKNYISEHTIY